MFIRTLLAVVAGFSVHATAFEFPLPKGPRVSNLLPPTFTADFNFEGIVALSNCSGSLVQLEGGKDTDRALVLTNGHCYENGMPRPGQVIYRRPANRRFTVMGPRGESLGRVNAVQVIYATMTKTDMALYQLQETYEQIYRSYNVRPLTLASQHPTVGTGIEVISGYWRRGYRCNIEHFVHRLDEEGWTMYDSIRYSRPGCEVVGGTSGSPVIMAGTRTVIGVNNTGNESGRRCTRNNPCEIDEQGNVTFIKGYSYGQQTYWIYSCLDANREFDLNVAGCLLPR